VRVHTTVHISTLRQQPTVATIHIVDMAAAMNYRKGAESCLGGQIIPHLLWNPTIRNTPPLIPNLEPDKSIPRPLTVFLHGQF
jgi:hypothetical protein